MLDIQKASALSKESGSAPLYRVWSLEAAENCNVRSSELFCYVTSLGLTDLKFFRHLVNLNLFDCPKVTDSVLQCLSRLSNLRKLVFSIYNKVL